MELLPVTPQWIHSYLLEPYLQGTTLLEFAWTGRDQSLIPKEFSWEDRIVSWIQGVCLLIPIIANIIWIVWKTFGNPKLLVDPYSPETIDHSPPPPPAFQAPAQRAQVQAPQLPPEGQVRQPEQFVVQEYFGVNLENAAYATGWNIQYFPDLVIATQTCNNPKFDASCIYGQNLVMKEFLLLRGERIFQIRIMDETKKVLIKYQDVGVSYEKELALPTDAPIIQHPVVGLRNFILSDAQETSFYGVVPVNPISSWCPAWLLRLLRSYTLGEPPLLEKVDARKVGIEEVHGYGPAMKVQSWSSRGFPFNLIVAEAWFDPQTGNLVKFNNPFTKMSGIFARTGPLPE